MESSGAMLDRATHAPVGERRSAAVVCGPAWRHASGEGRGKKPAPFRRPAPPTHHQCALLCPGTASTAGVIDLLTAYRSSPESAAAILGLQQLLVTTPTGACLCVRAPTGGKQRLGRWRTCRGVQPLPGHRAGPLLALQAPSLAGSL